MVSHVSADDLIAIEKLAKKLRKTGDLKEVVRLRNEAEAIRKRAKGDLVGIVIRNRAAELKLRAERKAGRLLSGLVRRGGDRKSAARMDAVTLSRLGIGHNQSARWKQAAAVPAAVFETYVREANRRGREITSQGLLQLGRSLANGHPDAALPGDLQEVFEQLFRSDRVRRRRTEAPIQSKNGPAGQENGGLVDPLAAACQTLVGRGRDRIEQLADCLAASRGAGRIRPTESRVGIIRKCFTELETIFDQLERLCGGQIP